MSCRSRGPVGAAWLFGAVLVILLATLPPQPGTTSGNFFRSVLPRNLKWDDVVKNLLLYCPLGVVLGARAASAWTAAGAAASVSLATELLQYAIPGRDPAARDVVANTLGALLAYSGVRCTPVSARAVNGLAAIERWLVDARNPTLRRASALLFRWACAVALVFATTAALLRPAPLLIGGLAVASPFLDRSHSPMRIGSSGARDGFFNGTIDEVRIYAQARTPEQIAEDMSKAQSPTPATEPGVIAAYGFNSNTINVAHDETGRGHDGSVSSARWTPDGRFGGALRFDGVASEVVVPHVPALDVQAALTLGAWVLASEKTSAEATVIGRSDDAYYLRATSNHEPFKAAGGGRFGAMPRAAHLGEPFRAGEWTHLAMTFDGQVIRLYVNGVLSSSRVHWSPHRPERVSVNGQELAVGLVPDPAAIRNALTTVMTLETTLLCGAPQETPAPALLIGGLQSSEALALVASGGDLFIKPLSHAGRMGLASPSTRVKGAIERCAETGRLPLTIAGPIQNPRVMHEHAALRAPAPGLGSGWAFVIHADLLPAWTEVVAAAVWLALLSVPIGMWARWTVLGVASVGLVVAALLFVPTLFHVREMYGYEAAAMIVGGVLGFVARGSKGPAISWPNGLAQSGGA
jgi:hypothetical protein